MPLVNEMRIVQITPGSGDNFYCENCLRDLELVKALRAQGHDVLLVPLYLPLQIKQDEHVSNAPIFFGGVNVYLQQKLSLFRKTPRWIDRWFDTAGLLRWVAPKAGMTSARDLGETTCSMLCGEHGRQIKELDRLADWLAHQDNQPDVVCLSNILLAGLARTLKHRLRVPILCWLEDEEAFVDGLTEPYAGMAWDLIREAADRAMDGFLCVSRFYRDRMKSRLRTEETKMHVVPLGVDTERYHPALQPPAVPAIGFLSRLCRQRGLDTLVEAFVHLKQNDAFGSTQLHVAGGHNTGDEDFIRHIKIRLERAGILGDTRFTEDFTFAARHRFLEGVSVVCVPETEEAAHALYLLEAQVMGVPVAAPRIGALPELVEATGGGVLYEGHSPDNVASALAPLLRDPHQAAGLGEKGRQGVLRHFDIQNTAAQALAVIHSYV